METKEKVNGQVNNATAVKDEKKNQFVAGNPVNSVSVKTDEVKKEEPKKEEAKPAVPATPAPAQPQGEAKPEPKKTVMNLEGTLKFIEELHRKAKQRIKLQQTIQNLDEFEVELRDEADSADTNYYNGCTLTIEDDNRRKFETKNPTIIWTVAQLVNNMCVDKLAEIEAGIVIPQ
jgi:hypothetical protein